MVGHSICSEKSRTLALTSCCRFGGTLLGPVRFTHVETCSREVCRTFKKSEEMTECLTTLRTLDDILANLREELNSLSSSKASEAEASAGATKSSDDSAFPPAHTVKRKLDYSSLQTTKDISRARRLIGARESSIKSVKTMISKKKATC